jgi:hypothetical protein
MANHPPKNRCEKMPCRWVAQSPTRRFAPARLPGRTAARGLLGAVTIVGLAWLVGCSDGKAGGERTVHRYDSRGLIMQMPAGGSDRTLMIKHEAIDDFVRDGEVVGMDSMVMPLPVAEDVSLSGLKRGEKVRFTLEVERGTQTGLQIVSLKRLPADTTLTFDQAEPSEADR